LAPPEFGPMSNALLITNNTPRGRINAFRSQVRRFSRPASRCHREAHRDRRHLGDSIRPKRRGWLQRQSQSTLLHCRQQQLRKRHIWCHHFRPVKRFVSQSGVKDEPRGICSLWAFGPWIMSTGRRKGRQQIGSAKTTAPHLDCTKVRTGPALSRLTRVLELTEYKGNGWPVCIAHQRGQVFSWGWSSTCANTISLQSNTVCIAVAPCHFGAKFAT
jgi:hypothetical protein